MAKIITLIAEAVDRATLQSKIILGQFGLYQDEKKLLVKDRSGNEYDFSSDQHVSDATNNYAQSTGVQWGGTATNVADALDELLSVSPVTTATARGFIAKATDDLKTIPANTQEIIDFPVLRREDGNVWDGTNTFTCDIDGAYLVTCTLEFNRGTDTTAGRTIIMDLVVNGTNATDYPKYAYNVEDNVSLNGTLTYSQAIDLVAGDEVQIQIQNPAGASLSYRDAFFSLYKQAELVTIIQSGAGASLWQTLNGIIKPLDQFSAVDNNGSIFNANTSSEITEALAEPQSPATLYNDSNTSVDLSAFLDGLNYPRTFDGSGAYELSEDTTLNLALNAVAVFLGGFNANASGGGHSLLLGSTTNPSLTVNISNAPIYVRRLKLQSNVTLPLGNLTYQEIDLNGFTITGATQSNWYSEGGTANDELVKISMNDTTSGYLGTKLQAGSNITLNTLFGGGDERLEIDATATTAGILETFFFTGDSVTLTAGTFYEAQGGTKGSTSLVSQVVSNNDNQKQFYAQDLISIEVTGNPRKLPPGKYEGRLTAQINSNSADQRYTMEIYQTDANGTPEASGVTGQPVGDLGVQVVAILDSGIVDNIANNPADILLTGFLPEEYTVDVGKRLRIHVSAEKVGSAGTLIDFTAFYGSSANSFIEVPSAIIANSVEYDNTTSGLSATNVQSAIDETVASLATFEYRGAWNNATTYDVGDIVTEDGYRWIAKAESTNQTPADGSSFWTRIDEQPTLDTFFVARNKQELKDAFAFKSEKRSVLYAGDDVINWTNERVEVYGDVAVIAPPMTWEINGDVDFSPPNDGTAYTRIFFNNAVNFNKANTTPFTVTTKNANKVNDPSQGTSFWFKRIRVQSTALNFVTWEYPSVTDGLRYEEAESQQGGQGVWSNFLRNLWNSPNYVEVESSNGSVTITETVEPATGATEETVRKIDLSVAGSRTTTNATNPSSVSPDGATTKQAGVNQLAQNCTLNMPTNPADGMRFTYRVEATGTHTLTWSGLYNDLKNALPTTTTANKIIYTGFVYNGNNSVWDVVSVVVQD